MKEKKKQIKGAAFKFLKGKAKIQGGGDEGKKKRKGLLV